jgi:hypothetical protein
MKTRLLAIVLLAAVASLTLSLIRGQERPASPPATTPPPVVEAPVAPAPMPTPAPDFSRLTEVQKQHLLTARRGADWLFRMHGVKGRFLPGYLPALRQVMEGDNYLRQAGAAAALARAARLCGEERYAARASQAILALLEDTAPDPGDSLSRCTTLPRGAVNRLGAAAALVLAIHELPAPQKDLLDRSDELCRFLARQARPDGCLAHHEGAEKAEDDGVNHYPGLALAALMHSQKHRPAAWKLDVVRKALPYYRAWWKEHRSPDFAPAQCAAFAEAFAATKEKPFAEFVAEMGDFLCGLQYSQIDPRRMGWFGGFMSYQGGRPSETEPHAGSACQAEGLVEACRVARELGDVERHQRYTDAVERALQFLATLQYTDARTYHFEAWFRPQLSGAFHASPRDGNLRLDYTQHPVAALLGYLEHSAR